MALVHGIDLLSLSAHGCGFHRLPGGDGMIDLLEIMALADEKGGKIRPLLSFPTFGIYHKRRSE